VASKHMAQKEGVKSLVSVWHFVNRASVYLQCCPHLLTRVKRIWLWMH